MNFTDVIKALNQAQDRDCQSAFKFDHPSASNFDQGKDINFKLISCAV